MSAMSFHSVCPNTLLSDSSLPSLYVTPTGTHTLQNPDLYTKMIIPSYQNKRVQISAQSDSRGHTNHATTIDTLPDDVLLEIFDTFRVSRTGFEMRNKPVWNWHTLVHVCRRWRQVVFASPIRLDLQLLCTYGTPVRKNLGCWPAFPIVIDYSFRSLDSEDNVIAALEHPSRVRRIKLTVTNTLWRKLATFMQEPFPALTHLSIFSAETNVPLLPSRFLGGSAPYLRELRFHGMPTLALPTLLSSAGNLVNLVLSDCDIPQDDYAALVTSLAMLPRLNNLSIAFVPCADHWQIHPLPETRAVLPALTSFTFDGESTFLEDFVSQIDTPLLNFIDITFLHFPDAQIPQLSEFINRSALKLSRFRDAKIYFDDGDTIYIFLGPGVGPDAFPIAIHITSCEGTYDQVSCMAQMLSQTPAMLSNVVHLEIKAERPYRLEDDYEELDSIDWLELLRPFTAVETLHVSHEFSVMVAHALEEMPAETANQVLPALYSLLLDKHT